MCLNNAAPDGWKRKLQYKYATLLRASAITHLPEYKATGKRAVALLISKLIVRGSIKDAILKSIRKYNNEKTEDVAHVFGRAKYKNAYYPARLFEKQRYVPFEQVMLAVPNGVEEYLTLRYGKDYMQMPSEETKAEYKTHTTVWDIEKDYTEFVK